MEFNWIRQKPDITKKLDEMQIPYQERVAEETLQNFIKQCGYQAHPMIVLLDSVSTVDAEIGVIVTHAERTVNDGVYIFCVLSNRTLGLITVIPSTISKGPMIRKITGDITNAITGVVTPPLTAFDMIEITGQVIANTVMRDLITAFNIPKEKEHSFICMYLPKFLANVAMYYTGAAKDGKPMVNEEIADIEPLQIRQMLMENSIPDIFKEKPVTERNDTT